MKNNILECPNPKVWFDKRGRVKMIERYCVVNNYTIASSSISVIRRKNIKGKNVQDYFKSCFDEHHRICDSNEPIEWEKISEEERKIFSMTRKKLETTKLEGIYSQLELAN